MIFKISSLFLLFLVVNVQANGNENPTENSYKNLSFPPFSTNWRINFGSGIESLNDDVQFSPLFPSYIFKTKVLPVNGEYVTEKNDYPNLENMDEVDAASTNVQTSKPSVSTFDDHHSWLGVGDLFKILGGISKATPWWRGENVCVEREEEDNTDTDADSTDPDDVLPILTSSINLQTCFQTESKYECIRKIKTQSESKTLTIRYQCCYGYRRIQFGNCEKIELIPLVDKIRKLNGTEFLTMAQNMEELLTEKNLTIFLPSNEAFKNFAEKMLETNRVELLVNPLRRRRNIEGITTEELLMAHMTEGFNEISPDESYPSLYDNSSLMMNHMFSRNEETDYLVNCAKILSSNNFATNGIIHTIDKVLMPVTKSIIEIIKGRREFSTFYQLLEKTGLANSLKDGVEIWTMLAPTNRAFEKLQSKHPHMMQKLLKGDSCTINILKHHMLSQMFCSSMVDSGVMGVKNSMGDLLTVTGNTNSTADDNNSDSYRKVYFYVDNVAVSETDIIATNGVIHAIDHLLIPDTAIPITSLLEKKKLTMFNKLIRKADMLEEINNLSNVTFIVPTDKAIKNYLKNNERSTDIEKMFSADIIKDEDKKELRSFIYHHIVPGALQSCDLDNNLMKQPMGKLSPLRINLYSTIPLSSSYNRATVDCAKLVHFDYQQCDNILHQIDRPLVNSNSSIMDWVKNNPKLTMLHKIIVGSEIENILEKRSGITFIAPTNEAFEKVSFVDYDLLVKDKDMVNVMMKQHIFDGVMCCAGLHNSPWPFTQTIQALNGHSLRASSNKIGSAPISSCDHMGNNGVVHFTNKLMVPLKLGDWQPGESNVDILLYGVNL